MVIGTVLVVIAGMGATWYVVRKRKDGDVVQGSNHQKSPGKLHASQGIFLPWPAAAGYAIRTIKTLRHCPNNTATADRAIEYESITDDAPLPTKTDNEQVSTNDEKLRYPKTDCRF